MQAAPDSSSQHDPNLAALARLSEQLTEGILFLDFEWRITYANHAAREISRVKPEYINARSLWEHYPEAAGTDIETVYRRVMASRKHERREFYYAPYDHWVEVDVYPIETGIALYYRDITRLRNAEHDRDLTTRQLAQVLDATTDAFVYLDRDFRFTYLNREARRRLSYFGNLIGKSLWQEFPLTADPESIYYKNFHQTLDTGKPTSFEAYYPSPLDAWFAINLQPADDGLVISFRDITAKRRDQEDLRRKTEEASRQLAELESLYETAPIGLAYFDPVEFRYLRLNDRQAAFFGMPKEQILGRTLTEMAPIPGLYELFVQTREGNPVINFPLEGELISNPGEHRYWTVNYFPVYGPDGKVQGITAASLEVTAQKKTELALIESEKLAAVGRLASSISHEINNPLEAVTNLLYLIATSPDLTDEMKSWVNLAQTELQRVSHIATETLRFHRQATSPTLVTAQQLVSSVLNLYQGRLNNSGIAVETSYSSKLPIRCFENNIRQVLNNLISNAMDAMRGNGGRLVVRAHDAIDSATGRSGLRITVADNGTGIPEHARKRIFEAFFTTKELNGTGLGLWISSDIVRQHHGRLTFRSTQHPIHHGTVFSLFLPHE